MAASGGETRQSAMTNSFQYFMRSIDSPVTVLSSRRASIARPPLLSVGYPSIKQASRSRGFHARFVHDEKAPVSM